jgi:hypothetical protein
MDIHQLIKAAGSVQALADKLREPYTTVAKWRDRGKISRRAQLQHARAMRRLISTAPKDITP